MATFTNVSRIDTGQKPRALFFNGEKSSFYVAEGLAPKASVALINLSDQRVARRYQPKGLLSRWLVLPRQNRLLAARLGEPILGVYKLKDWHLVKTIAVGGEVTALAADKNAWWAATRQADSLARLSPRDLSLQAVALAGPEPRGLVLDSNRGEAYVACQGRQGESHPMAMATATIENSVLSPLSPDAEVDNGGDSSVATASDEPADVDDGGELTTLVSNLIKSRDERFDGGGVAIFRLQDTRRLDYIDVPGGPTQIVLSPDGKRLALACADKQLRMLDLESRKVVHILALGGVPGAMLSSPDEKELWVALSDSKQLLRLKPGQGW